MFTDVINKGSSRIIFLKISIPLQVFQKTEESPPAGQSKEWKFDVLPHLDKSYIYLYYKLIYSLPIIKPWLNNEVKIK